MAKEELYTRSYAVKMPATVADALDKYVEDMHDDSPSFTGGDFIRLAVVAHLKKKGYLANGGKKYL